MKTCSVDLCDRELRARGLCNTHHAQASRHGVLNLYQTKAEQKKPLCWCGQPADSRLLCRPHYDAMRYGPTKRSPKVAKIKKERAVKQVRPKAEPKHQGPRGIIRSIPMTGRVSPSPFKDGGTSGRNVDRLPDGFLSGSVRSGSYQGIKHPSYFMLHRDDDCSWIDLARCRVIDVWEHSEAGQYAIDRNSLARATVKFCQLCDRRLAQVGVA